CMYRDMRPTGTMPFSDLEALLPKLQNKAQEVYVSCAGESLILDDLPERVALVRSFFPEAMIGLTTSLCVPREHAYFRTLAKAGLNLLQISCYAHDREDYSTVHGRDVFETVRENIRMLQGVKRGVDLIVALDMLEDTGRHFDLKNADHKKASFTRFALANGVDYVSNKELFTNQGRNKAVTLQEYRQPFPCSVVWAYRANSLSVTWDLDVIPCPYLREKENIFGNLRYSSLEEIFSSSLYRAFYQTHWNRDLGDLPVCRVCNQPNHQASADELLRLTAYEAQRLAGREVYFWGCGEAYRQFAVFFSACRPHCILYDAQDEAPLEVDGIVIRHPDDVLLEGPVLPLIIFASPMHSRRIMDTIRQRYPRYVEANIVLCDARQEEWFA
ncbi:SPASM domain-containing protein, partial [Desulfovibrio sp. OttesenSCG-928-M14]|nr:SPASM domain-containing protein [Desulfovibrio sp. OttesenSCG-928-M14]